ncbi:zwei Ig domain protein zig-8-like isoform X2 [Homarus americanus]|uniref:zwei Ig domain protein zig-8-like isoform X2 n=1 Tax=Homarus americanus TaxID=6706 RepID=UPI001C43A33A|nr:zwei Ig domain protein zig-8-like isoform X2 [Homarus americanus]XP_042230502.1 zwei Ig domain protein zig-8-like isoform X2 [Homarus americanus]XP_042230503.1 zwei Ig domain protein zig-8-like isoform X2 [Homarus americanus]XP_042230505.1 zwei Ig domain protein zig-8-like isoform X2 [Homarus americanus]
MTSTYTTSCRQYLLWLLLSCYLGVSVTDDQRDAVRPEFGAAESTVTVKEGETAKLPCVVLHLNDKSVTWLRRRDLHILTVGHLTYSADQRFQVVHAEGSQEWTLVVRYTQLRDAGVYECQVNTEPKLSRHVTLRVQEPRPPNTGTKTKVFVANNTASTKDGNLRVEILGPRELYIEEGSSLTLTCLVTSLRGPSALVYWYHDISLIDYNSPRGGVNLKIDRGRGETTTRLVVSSVGPGDSGMYSCVPQGSHPATVLVHVQKGEHEAAIQQGGLGESNSSTTISSCFLLLFLFLITSFICVDSNLYSSSTASTSLHNTSSSSSITSHETDLHSSPSRCGMSQSGDVTSPSLSLPFAFPASA